MTSRSVYIRLQTHFAGWASGKIKNQKRKVDGKCTVHHISYYNTSLFRTTQSYTCICTRPPIVDYPSKHEHQVIHVTSKELCISPLPGQSLLSQWRHVFRARFRSFSFMQTCFLSRMSTLFNFIWFGCKGYGGQSHCWYLGNLDNLSVSTMSVDYI